MSLSFFRFRNKCGEKGAPGCVCYRCVESGLAACPVGRILSRHFVPFGLRPFDHVAHGQGLDGDQPEAVDQRAGLLLHEVLAPPPAALMDARYDLAPFASCWGVLLRLGETALRLCQVLCFFPEKSGVVDVFTSGEESKGLEPHIDAYLLIRRGD